MMSSALQNMNSKKHIFLSIYTKLEARTGFLIILEFNYNFVKNDYQKINANQYLYWQEFHEINLIIIKQFLYHSQLWTNRWKYSSIKCLPYFMWHRKLLQIVTITDLRNQNRCNITIAGVSFYCICFGIISCIYGMIGYENSV